MYWALRVEHKTQNIAEKNMYWGEEQHAVADGEKQ